MRDPNRPTVRDLLRRVRDLLRREAPEGWVGVGPCPWCGIDTFFEARFFPSLLRRGSVAWGRRLPVPVVHLRECGKVCRGSIPERLEDEARNGDWTRGAPLLDLLPVGVTIGDLCHHEAKRPSETGGTFLTCGGSER